MPACSTIIRMLHAKLVPQIASISLRVWVFGHVVAASVAVVVAVTVAPFELFFQLGLLSTAIILLAVCCSNLINYQRNYKLC